MEVGLEVGLEVEVEVVMVAVVVVLEAVSVRVTMAATAAGCEAARRQLQRFVEQVVSWRWEATDALVAVGTDVVVAWQCSHCLVEQTSEQMAVGADAVPSSVASTTLQQVVSPHSTASNRTALMSG